VREDPGIYNTLAPIDSFDFSPRVGLAWSPQAEAGSIFARLLDAPRSTGVRASFGTFYTATLPGALNFFEKERTKPGHRGAHRGGGGNKSGEAVLRSSKLVAQWPYFNVHPVVVQLNSSSRVICHAV